jgi:hypothetical protein
MACTEDQLRRIRYLLYDEWVEADPQTTQANLDRALAQVQTSEELHQFAANFNWDTGADVLEKVVKHPLCDKGTALMIYFLGKPEWYYNHLRRGKSLIGDQPKMLAFLQSIERMVSRGEFTSSNIAFDPTRVRGVLNSLAREGADLVPDYMKQPLVGEGIELLKLW